MSVWSDRSMIFITKIKLKVCPPRYHSTGSLQLIQLWLLLMHSHTEHEKGETINYLLTTASVLLEKEHCWAGYWPGHSNIDTDYCSSSTSIHSFHCCEREEEGSFVFTRTNPHIWCPWHIGSMNVVFIHMFIQVVNVLTHWSSWRGSEVGTLEIKLQKVLHFKESHRHGHKAELEPGCQGLPHCPWGVGCHCWAYPWGEKLPLTSLYVPCKGSSQHVLSLEIIIASRHF